MNMKVNLEALKDRAGWEKAGVRLPAYDVELMRKKTVEKLLWVHFGAGNIFRAFIAALQQRLLDEGLSDRGIIAADTFDVDNIRMIYGGYDNLTMSVTLSLANWMSSSRVSSMPPLTKRLSLPFRKPLSPSPAKKRITNVCSGLSQPLRCR